MNENDLKPLKTLTLRKRNLSRREIFQAEHDAVKSLFLKNLGRPTSAREIIMAKQDAVNLLKAKRFDEMLVEFSEAMMASAMERMAEAKQS
jgi:hypothetical protein